MLIRWRGRVDSIFEDEGLGSMRIGVGVERNVVMMVMDSSIYLEDERPKCKQDINIKTFSLFSSYLA